MPRKGVACASQEFCFSSRSPHSSSCRRRFALRFTDDSYNMPQGTGSRTARRSTAPGAAVPPCRISTKFSRGRCRRGSRSRAARSAARPTQGGDYDFWVELSDQNPPSACWCVPTRHSASSRSRSCRAEHPAERAQPGRCTNAPYNFQLTADGGALADLVGRLGRAARRPHAQLERALSGTPTATGDSTFQIQVTDGSRTDTETYTLSVVEPLKITPHRRRPARLDCVPLAPHDRRKAGLHVRPDGRSAGRAHVRRRNGAITGKPTVPPARTRSS